MLPVKRRLLLDLLSPRKQAS